MTELTLEEHEARSQGRYENLKSDLSDYWKTLKEREMSMSDITDKVNIHVGEGRGSDGGAMAALVAALGNRNSPDNTAALIAALGNRNEHDSAAWAPMMAAMAGGGGFGGNNALWPIILLALLGRGRGGGLFGGDDCGGGSEVNQLTLTEVLSKLGSIEGAIPLAASQVENSICEQTNQLSTLFNQQSLATLAAIANTKDAVQNTGTVLLSATKDVGSMVQTTGLQTQIAIGTDGDRTRAAIAALASKIDSNTIADLQRQLTVSQLSEAEERNRRALDAVRVEVSQNVNQQQGQLQAQLQFQRQSDEIAALRRGLEVSIANQRNRSDQDLINLGTMVGNAQTAANTNVR